MDCSVLESVFRAIESEWSCSQEGSQPDVYRHLVYVLNEKGFLVDIEDGLKVLEHCRRHGLPVVDVLNELDVRLRKVGYAGGRLSLADLTSESHALFVFFDPNRFSEFAQVRERVKVA